MIFFTVIDHFIQIMYAEVKLSAVKERIYEVSENLGLLITFQRRAVDIDEILKINRGQRPLLFLI